jgi:Aldo/keto reductase family
MSRTACQASKAVHENTACCGNRLRMTPALVSPAPRDFSRDHQHCSNSCRVPAGSVQLVLSYCHHALNDRSMRELLPYLREKGVGVVNGSVLSMGLLTNKVLNTAALALHCFCQVVAVPCRLSQACSRDLQHAVAATSITPPGAAGYGPATCDAPGRAVQGPPDWHPAPQEVKEAAAKAAQHARDAGVDIAKLAIMDAVRAEDIPTNLVGCASREQVPETCPAWCLLLRHAASVEKRHVVEAYAILLYCTSFMRGSGVSSRLQQRV